MTKIFPKSRVCVIDAYPSLERGVKTAILFARKHNISLVGTDGKNLITTFSLRQIEETYNKTLSSYNKVLCMSYKKAPNKISLFIDNYFDKVLKKNSLPYCGQYELDSPDLETAAQKTVESQPKNKKQQFVKLLKSLNLRNV